jgi:hypothetical protein
MEGRQAIQASFLCTQVCATKGSEESGESDAKGIAIALVVARSFREQKEQTSTKLKFSEIAMRNA